MLIRKAVLEGIQAGRIDLAFRRWRRPTVKSGGALKTALGVLDIETVEVIDPREISERDARRAGYPDKAALLNELGCRAGAVYRISLRYAGEDPRIALREKDQLTASEFADLRRRLQRFDAASRAGPWTLKALQAIDRHPDTAAARLADKTGFEKQWLKVQVRKLKNLGLTISRHPGYRLSPRGQAVLRRLNRS